MALAALAIKSINVVGNKRVVHVSVTLNAYAIGGQPITAAALGLLQIETVKLAGGNATAAVLAYWFDLVNSKLMALTSAGGALAEVGNGTDLSTYVVDLEVTGV